MANLNSFAVFGIESGDLCCVFVAVATQRKFLSPLVSLRSKTVFKLFRSRARMQGRC